MNNNNNNSDLRPRISDETRHQVVFYHQQKMGYKKIAQTLYLAQSTVRNIIKKHQRTGTVNDLPKTGRPRKTSKRVDKLIVKQFDEMPFSTARDVEKYINENNLANISSQTVRRRSKEAQIRCFSARRKPLLSKINIEKRLFFAKKFVNKPIEFWEKVIWTDECKFNMCQSDRMKRVYRKKGQAMNPKYIIPTVKHGGGSNMAWGCMASSGVGSIEFINVKMNALIYVDILRNNLEFSSHLLGFGNDFLFQQDNDPKHTAKLTSDWLIENDIKLLITPPQSPDLNPIEHLWSEIKRKLGDKRFTNKEQHRQAIIRIWNEFDHQKTKKLVDNMPKRLEAIIKANGGHIPY